MPDYQGRTARRRDLLFIEGSPDHHRAMEETLQHQTTSQRPWIHASSTRKHNPIAAKANHALTFKPDQSNEAGQSLIVQSSHFQQLIEKIEKIS